MSTDYGTVQHNGQTLTLTQQAYVDMDHEAGSTIYVASAVDESGNTYRVVWAQYGGFDGDDESNAADWDRPARVDVIDEVQS